MRAKDYIELNCKNQFYNELKRVINDLSLFRKDKNATENYFELYLNQDRKHKLFEYDLRDWKLNNLNVEEMPKYIEIEGCIPYRDAYNFRNHLYNVIQSDKSFGYLFYFLASDKNRNEIFYQNHPIDCIPYKQIIEENIIKYQDDYPKHNLDAYLTYNDFNYIYYKANKKFTHTKDFWVTIFTTSYSLFDNLRTKMVSPFLAFDLIKEFNEKDKNKKILIITFVSQLLERYNYDLTEDQLKGKNILVDEINDYLKLLNEGKIPADPNIRSVGWLSEHPDLMTTQEQQDLLNSFKLIKDFGTKLQSIFPPFELVKSKIDDTPEIDDKISILKEVIATWKVNKNIAVKHRKDNTAEETAEPEISLFNDLLEYLESMKEIQSNELNSTKKFESNLPPEPESKSKIEFNSLKSNLHNNGFFEISKVKILSHDGQTKLIDLLVLNKIPYVIALFEYIGFMRYLYNEKRFTYTKIEKLISSWFDIKADTVKGNRLALNDSSKIDKNRYTSHLHIEKVKTDYYSLK